jgi:predicted HTH domain antitoxin
LDIIHIDIHISEAEMKRTNVLLTDGQHKSVKAYAKREGKTLGRMVREALDAAYQKKDPLERRKETALSAYREGFISLGKVAEVLGLDPVSARAYLREAGVLLQVQDAAETGRDANRA